MEIMQLFTKDHFGNLATKVYKDIEQGNSCLISGAPGSGCSYFLQNLKYNLKKHETYYFEAGLLGKNFVAEIDSKIKGLNAGLQNISARHKLIILLNAVQESPHIERLLTYLNQLRKANLQNVVIICVVDHSYFGSNRDNFELAGNFFQSRYTFPPFDFKGVLRIIKVNNIYFGYKTPLALATKIFELSGGNARMVKYISKAIYEKGEPILENLPQLMEQAELKHKLNYSIKTVLTTSNDALQTLGVIDANGKIRSTLLAYGIKEYIHPIPGQYFPGLSLREQQLLGFFLLNKNSLVSQNRIDMFLNISEENWSLWANYKSINRLQQKIKAKYILKNIKGKGYLLLDA